MAMLARMLCLIAVLLCPIAAQAQGSKLDTILAQGVLRVGVAGDYRPFALRDPATGVVAGIDIDLAQRLAASLGVKLEVVGTKWADLMADLRADRFDIAMGGVSITLARQRIAVFSTPTMRTGKSAIARCADGAKFPDLAAVDRAGVRVITNPGGTNEQFDRAMLKSAEIVVFPDNIGIWDALLAGAADLMITDNVETRLQQKLHPGLCAIRPEAPFNFDEKGWMMPRDEGLRLYVDQFLHIETETGGLARTISKFLD